MGQILDLKNKYIYIVEDVAQAFGAKYEGKPLGTIGDVDVTHFFQLKF